MGLAAALAKRDRVSGRPRDFFGRLRCL